LHLLKYPIPTLIFLGNFFDVLPYEGYYDAASLSKFNIHPSKDTVAITNATTLDIKGQVRDLKWIDIPKYGKVLIVARNNSPLQFYELTK